MKDPFEYRPTHPGKAQTAPESGRSDDMKDEFEVLFDRLAAFQDRTAAWRALVDMEFLRALAQCRLKEHSARRALNRHVNPEGVLRGLAMLFPLTAEWLLILDPVRHGDIEVPVASWVRVIDGALATQDELLQRLAHFCQVDLERLPAIRAQVHSLREHLAQVGAEQAAGARELQRLEQEREVAEAGLQAAREALVTDRARQEQLAGQLQGLREETVAKESELADVRKENDTLERAVAEQQQRHRQVSEQVAAASAELDALKSALEAYRSMSQASRLLEEIDDIRARVGKLRVPDRLDGLGG